MVSATGTTSMSWVAAARSAARRWVTETWRGWSSSIRRPRPSRRAARASGRRRGRRSPAGGRTGRTGRRRSTPRRRPARRASGPGTSRAARSRTSAAARARAHLEDGPDAGEVGEGIGDARPSPSTTIAAHRRGRYMSPRAATTIPAAVTNSLRTTVAGAATLDARRGVARAGRRPSRPSVAPSRRSGRCRSGRATGPGSAAAAKAGCWNVPVVVERERAVRHRPPARQQRRAPRRSPDRQLHGADLEVPAGAQADGSAVMTRTVGTPRQTAASGRTHPGRSTIARSPGPSAGSSNGPPQISAPSTASE